MARRGAMMRYSILLILHIVVQASSDGIFNGSEQTMQDRVIEALKGWEAYKEKYDKTYDANDEIIRMHAYIENSILVDEHNREADAGRQTFRMELNRFADKPNSHYSKVHGFLYPDLADRKKSNASRFLIPFNAAIPDSLDWRVKGLVTPVKDQGECGSCWAFSAVGSLEGQHARASGNLVELSEQNLVDCSHDYGNFGCLGGTMNNAFQYIKENHGIDTEDSYPYNVTFEDEECKFKKENVGADDKGFAEITKGDEEALRAAVATIGPISVGIDETSSFELYQGGVFYDKFCTTTRLLHAVVVVGYGTDEKYGEYWIVKNSYGTKWGESGYIRMARNKNNHCGIASAASYPIV